MKKRLLNIPVSKSFTEASIQDETKYSGFIEQTNIALGQDRFSLLSRNTFDRKTKREFKRKKSAPILRLLFWTSSITALTISLAPDFLNQMRFDFSKGTPDYIFEVLFIFFLGGLIIGSGFYHKYVKNSPDSHHAGGLIEESNNLERANILLKWAENIISNNISLFIKDTVSGEIYNFSEALPDTRNNIMSLLGDEYHRKTLGVKGRIPNGKILYLKDDEDKLFQSLRDAISEISKEAPPPEIQNPEKASNKIKPNLPPAKRKYPSRDYRYHKTVLLKKDMLKLVVEAMKPNGEFYNLYIDGEPTRKRWLKALLIINSHPAEWEKFLKAPKGKESIKFSEKLYGENGLNTSNSNEQLKFRTGENYYLNDLIKKTGVIPDEKLVPKGTKLK